MTGKTMDREKLIQTIAGMREQNAMEMRTSVGYRLQSAFNLGFRDLPTDSREITDVINDVADLAASFVSLSLVVAHDSCFCAACQTREASHFSKAIAEYGYFLASVSDNPVEKAVR